MKNNLQFENKQSEFHLKAELDKYLIHWKWIVLWVILCLSIAFIYIRYTTPMYKALTTILVKDESKGGMLSELSAFSDLGLGGGMKNNVDNEIEILRSRTLVESTVKSLNLNVAVFVEGSVVKREIYRGSPILITFINKKSNFNEARFSIQFIEINSNTFRLKENINEGEAKIILNDKKYFKYDSPIETIYGDFIISRMKEFRFLKGNHEIFIEVSPFDEVVDNFKNQVLVNPLSKTSSVVELSIVDPILKKSEDFLNSLVQIYNNNAVADKNFIYKNTSEFIGNRLRLISQELSGVEKDVENFKKANKLTDINSEAKLFIEGSNEYDKKGVEIEIQINVVTSMLAFMRKSTNSDLLPNNLISGKDDASSLIGSYNQLILDRNRILKSATLSNPSVLKMDQQIASLKSTITASLQQLQSNLEIQKKDLDSNEVLVNEKIEKIPVQERQFRVIERQQKVKEELYLYLLQKREEAAISLSATEPNARVIDLARASHNPVAPKKNIIYLAALFLGLLIPIGFVNILNQLDTKIKTRSDFDRKTAIPYLGDIPTSNSKTLMIKSESKTSSAEALRMIRTNMEFMLTKVPEKQAKTIFLTSTLTNEGKTFVSVNLAATFALSGKKVLLIGMDIRNPKLNEYLTLPEQGLTNYLSNQDTDLEHLIIKQEGYENFYVLPAGIIPPNPAELLLSNKVDTLFNTLKTKYDYIFVDTAPVRMVTDTLLIAKHADCFLYIVRANYLEKRMLTIANELYSENKLPNMCLLLNDTDSSKNLGYEYAEIHNKKAWYKKLWDKK